MTGINEEAVDKVIKQIEELLAKMGIEAETKAKIQESQGLESILVDIKTPDGNLLIGQRGQSLDAFQHLARVILRKKLNQIINFIVDVNDYRKKKEQYLKDLALDAASKVKSSSEEIELAPMSSYERRIIHLVLAENEEVATESIGEEPERRVVIKPKVKK